MEKPLVKRRRRAGGLSLGKPDAIPVPRPSWRRCPTARVELASQGARRGLFLGRSPSRLASPLPTEATESRALVGLARGVEASEIFRRLARLQPTGLVIFHSKG